MVAVYAAVRTVIHCLNVLERVSGPADAADSAAGVVRRRAVRCTVEQVGDERIGIPGCVVSHPIRRTGTDKSSQLAEREDNRLVIQFALSDISTLQKAVIGDRLQGLRAPKSGRRWRRSL